MRRNKLFIFLAVTVLLCVAEASATEAPSGAPPTNKAATSESFSLTSILSMFSFIGLFGGFVVGSITSFLTAQQKAAAAAAPSTDGGSNAENQPVVPKKPSTAETILNYCVGAIAISTLFFAFLGVWKYVMIAGAGVGVMGSIGVGAFMMYQSSNAEEANKVVSEAAKAEAKKAEAAKTTGTTTSSS